MEKGFKCLNYHTKLCALALHFCAKAWLSTFNECKYMEKADLWNHFLLLYKPFFLRWSNLKWLICFVLVLNIMVLELTLIGLLKSGSPTLSCCLFKALSAYTLVADTLYTRGSEKYKKIKIVLFDYYVWQLVTLYKIYYMASVTWNET